MTFLNAENGFASCAEKLKSWKDWGRGADGPRDRILTVGPDRGGKNWSSRKNMKNAKTRNVGSPAQMRLRIDGHGVRLSKEHEAESGGNHEWRRIVGGVSEPNQTPRRACPRALRQTSRSARRSPGGWNAIAAPGNVRRLACPRGIGSGSSGEFTSKPGGAPQEADVSAMRLELLRGECGINPALTAPLGCEACEWTAILAALINRTKKKQN